MGEYAEEYLAHRYPEAFGSRSHRSWGFRAIEKWDYAKPEDCIWTTKGGEKIRFADMKESHRENVLRMFVREGGKAELDTPTARALIRCGVSESFRKEWGLGQMKVRGFAFTTNQDAGIPRK